MTIIYRFTDGQEQEIEVQGEIKDFYLELAGLHPDDAPDVMNLTKIEDRIGRKHTRSHKYTGFPVSYEEISENGEQVADQVDTLTQIEFDIDYKQALSDLTDIQRYCFTEVCIRGKSQRYVAEELSRSKSFVTQAINGARKKLKKYF